mgnify:CR=1 FL=1
MKEIFEKLTDYTLALKEGLATTNQANERPLLTGRLAVAAEMYALLHQTENVSAIQELAQSELRAHGWSFISGQAGENIANKWVAFTNAIGIK